MLHGLLLYIKLISNGIYDYVQNLFIDILDIFLKYFLLFYDIRTPVPSMGEARKIIEEHFYVKKFCILATSILRNNSILVITQQRKKIIYA